MGAQGRYSQGNTYRPGYLWSHGSPWRNNPQRNNPCGHLETRALGILIPPLLFVFLLCCLSLSLSLSPLRSKPDSDRRFALPEQCRRDATYPPCTHRSHPATPAAPQQSIDSNTYTNTKSRTKHRRNQSKILSWKHARCILAFYLP